MPKVISEKTRGIVLQMYQLGNTERETRDATKVSRGAYHQIVRRERGRPIKVKKLGRKEILAGDKLKKAIDVLTTVRRQYGDSVSPTWGHYYEKLPKNLRDKLKPRTLASSMRKHDYRNRPRRKA